MQLVRYLYAAVAVGFLAGVAYQVFLAGMAVFGAGQWANHVDFGYLVAAVPLLLVILAWPARAGRSTLILSVVTLLVAQVQTFLPAFREDLPVVAALHPVNAMLVFGCAVLVARRGIALARQPLPAAPTAPDPVRA
ncbi:MAG TPA: DUF6220 domain-containing protein [Candidatus Limnocylindria bacterium]